MFIFWESLRSSIDSILAHRLRSFLTSLGIIVGVASIIALTYIIQGLSGNVTKLFRGLGSDSLTISSFTPQEKQLRGEYARLTQDDLRLIKQRITGISSITPIMYSQVNQLATSQVTYEGSTAYTRVFGTTYTYRDVAQHTVKYGRFISPSDNETRRRVCIIGEEIRKKLELPLNPVGEFVEVGGEWIKIIGLMEEKGDLLNFNQDDFVVMPYSTMGSLAGNQNEPDIQILLKVNEVSRMESMQQDIARLLSKSHKLKPSDEDDFKIQTPKQLLSGFSNFVGSVTYFMIGVVSISLLVGGIGIMNIMLVSVNERTREIGIRKAIGAKRSHIMLQFVIEALLISLIGGLIGILFGWGLGVLAAQILDFQAASVPAWAVFLSLGFSVFVGVSFGILPAAKASSLDPIEALRYE